jgi:TonB family protein
LIIDSDGIPQNIRIVKSVDTRLDESAIKAVEQWRYKPALLNGVPVPVVSEVIVKFEIDGKN